MNVVLALLLIALTGLVGGIGHGFMADKGAVLPRLETKDVKVAPDSAATVPTTIWRPGIIGHAIVGILASLVVFCVFSAPAVLVGSTATVALTLYMVGTSLLAALGGSVAIDELIKKRQWSSLAPTLEQMTPGQGNKVVGGDPLQTFRSLPS